MAIKIDSFNISDKEIKDLANKYNISIKEMQEDITIHLKELIETSNGIKKTIVDNNYIRFPNSLNIFGYGENNELNDNYLCYTPNILNILKKDKKDIAVVSGFGATSSPTVGTLSMILKLIEFQSRTGLYTYLIINDLGTINARNIDVNKVLDLTEQFKQFVVKMGFDLNNGEIRTHNDLDHARTFSLVSRAIKLSDFTENGEATDETYNRLNLKGNDFSVMVDHLYTAADVLLPILKDGKSGVIVPCGLEEYYHANIGGIALNVLMQDPSIKDLIPEKVQVGAVYRELISGFFPYFKQSKSIPRASVYLGDTVTEIHEKIINVSERDEQVVLEMIKFTPNWDKKEITNAEEAFNNRANDYKKWQDYKERFVEYFISIKKIWDSCEVKNISIKEKLYN